MLKSLKNLGLPLVTKQCIINTCKRRKGLAALTVPRIQYSHNYFRGVIMTIGIYALYWEQQDLVYVGQSLDIESRGRSHLSKMRLNKHSNYKVQESYNSFGLPVLIIIEICAIDQLDSLEHLWTEEFSALSSDRGLCIVAPGLAGRGTEHHSSIYSRTQILKVFSLLYKTKLSVLDISLRTRVSECNIRNILCGNRHIWLKEEHPEKYLSMLSRDKFIRRLSTKVTLVSPSGVTHNVDNIKEFSNFIEIPATSLAAKIAGFTKVIYGKSNQYKGWKIFTT